MAITPYQTSIINHFAEQAASWGMTRSHAQVFGYIVVRPDPICVDDIVDDLKMTYPNASASIRELQGKALVKQVHLAGKRRKYFTLNGSMEESLMRISEQKRQMEWEPTVRLLESFLKTKKGRSISKPVLHNLQTLLTFIENQNQLSKTLQGIEPVKLFSLFRKKSLAKRVCLK